MHFTNLISIQIAYFVAYGSAAYQNQILSNDNDDNHHSNSAKHHPLPYRIAYPNPEDFIIDLLINPCGANATHDDPHIHYTESQFNTRHTLALGYDCCMNQYGRGEYGFLKYHSSYHNGDIAMNDNEVLQRRLLAPAMEVSHNIMQVDEHGTPIPTEYSRRADDHTVVDESCRGLRDPHTQCIDMRLAAVRSPYVAACWDHNQTVDATIRCHTPDGKRRRRHCMQVSYSQNAFIHICGNKGDAFSPKIGDHDGDNANTTAITTATNNADNNADNNANNNDHNNANACGTYIEIHRSNGSPYDEEETILASTKIDTLETNGMLTTTIDLHYKNQKDKILCAYEETQLRIGTMVRIIKNADNTGDSGICCCPPKYNSVTHKGSFYCPMHPLEKRVDTVLGRLESEHKRQEQYNNQYQCPHHDEDKDILMCNRILGGDDDSTTAPKAEFMNFISGSQALYYSEPCDGISLSPEGKYGSRDLHGSYSSACQLGSTFRSCGGLDTRMGDDDWHSSSSSSSASSSSASSSASSSCAGIDFEFSFHNRIGKIVNIPNETSTKYSVTFNDGRTSYDFPPHLLQMEQPSATYELWFVQRNRFESILQKRKGFRVIWPLCTFDSTNNRYFPYAQKESESDGDGTSLLRVL